MHLQCDAITREKNCALLVINHGSMEAPHSARATRAFTERLAASGSHRTGGCRVHNLGSLIPAPILDIIRRDQAGERFSDRAR